VGQDDGIYLFATLAEDRILFDLFIVMGRDEGFHLLWVSKVAFIYVLAEIPGVARD
jgi:hypothetical protein